ncbi:RNA 2',3'-cyclic phosphodiesterase [Lutispora thermophila]|uniref:RNA 2',3'-cyclic phosphodiesterase n=1 Tax=Lutispora thermophila DSM 19022 TaxID=1122184 RepID=A0A1M6B8A5_9FIRM|nr:RNA 2',3'-cyclic phosphodiesterase [Lutispora thermophila]SHI44945.1 2'-5' RNA ligase [Lutispora thermophila DSM 19022]
MRTFIGIDFDMKIKDEIKNLQSVVKENSIRGRFKYVANFHLTLKFLGEITENQIPLINEVLKRSADNVGDFSLIIEKLGFFGGKGANIRTLWLGLGGDLDSLNALYENIEDGLSVLGFEKEKRTYTPHITIAQDLLLNKDFHELRKTLDLSRIPSINVREVSLIKSEQIQGRRVYTPISTFKLIGQ